MKVSIVMPVKNAMPYLESCLDSILAQTYTDWELIAINDGSTDDSAELLLSYADRDSRISTYDNVGSGIIPALELAYSHTSGALITRMDADDMMTTDRIEIMANSLIEQPGHIAVGQVKYFSDEGTLGDGYQKYQDWLNGLTAQGNNFTEIYKECVIPSPCWMMHRVDFEKINGFDINTYPEDYDLAFRMYVADLKVIPCSQILHHWRDYPTRTSRTDDNYADNRFLDIKVHYFISKDYKTGSSLILWGAGKKGKMIAQKLVEQKINFHWICDNPNKIGHDIYGVILKNPSVINEISDTQIIGAVAGDSGVQIQTQISNISTNLKAYWFC